MKNNGEKSKSFTDLLERLLNRCEESKDMTIKEIFNFLAGKGYPALLILLAVPFCIPIQIPGFSTPFGLVLMFLGFRMAFWRRLWWPKWILDKRVSSGLVVSIVEKVDNLFRRLQRFFHPRLLFVIYNPLLRRINGLLVAVLAFILALPLPIPMTNLLSAIPIVCLGIGLLENDGLMILIGYAIAFIWLAIILGAFLFGRAVLSGTIP